MTHEQMIAFCFCDFMFCWSEGLSYRERNASTERHNNDSTELGVNTAT